MTARGPVVIDWADAAAGDFAYDVAETCALMATATHTALTTALRRRLLASALSQVDAPSARARIPSVVERRLGERP